ALAVATRTVNFSVDAVWTGDGAALRRRICINRIGNRYSLLADIVEDIRNLTAKRVRDIFSLPLEEWLLFAWRPIGNIATPTTGRAAILHAPLTIGADDPAAPATIDAKHASRAIADGTGYHLVQPLNSGT